MKSGYGQESISCNEGSNGMKMRICPNWPYIGGGWNCHKHQLRGVFSRVVTLPEASIWPKFSGVGEYDHMELIGYIDGLCIDVPSIPDYWITARLNTAFQGNASIWYTEMKDIHGRRKWP
ncbi:hypothetical protein O181_014513 [Austropuccinia psidii MF-1]|uniref:Uncharacterized protein n=1 Tax=Austropuccinia psidii MF-1 TaxID=1389203 RepID=A0A9Q3C0P2_9BASI|nr:hypothetical protein [Austropuccinia psidii MF-1]